MSKIIPSGPNRKKTPIKGRKNVNYKPAPKMKGKWHWSLTLLLIFWFSGFTITLLHFFGTTVISLKMIGLLTLGFGLVSMAIHTPIFNNIRKKKGGERLLIGKQMFVVYNIFGVGLFLTSMFLQLNFSFKKSEPKVEYIKVLEIDPNYRPGAYSGIVYILEENKYDEEVDYRWFDVSSNTVRKTKPYVKYEFHTGLFGFDVFGNRYLVSDPEDNNPSHQPYL